MGPIRDMLSDIGITEQQWRILRVLEESGPQDASTLAERACLLMPSQTRILQTLVQKGLIMRDVDPIDRRKQTIKITDAGRKVIDDKRSEAEAIAQNIEEIIGKKKLATLLSILDDFDKL